MYKLLLSLRYLRSRFMAVAAFLAVGFGVAMLFIVLSVMGGYGVELRRSIRGREADLQVSGLGQFGVSRLPELMATLRSHANVRAAAPFVERLSIYSGGGAFVPCLLQGIDPRLESETTDLARFVLRRDELRKILAAFPPARSRAGRERRVREGRRLIHDRLHAPGRVLPPPGELEGLFSDDSVAELLRREAPELLEALAGDLPPAALVDSGLVLGQDMFLGQVINVLTLSPRTGEPLSLPFVVAGVLQPPEIDQDSRTVVAHLDLIKNELDLFDLEHDSYRYQGIRVALKDPDALSQTQAELRAALARVDPRLRVESWETGKRPLLRAVEIEKFLVYFLVLILVFFTGSMILLMLVLTVIEKTRDVGVVMALGATPGGVTSIFLLNGLLICLLGEICGLGLGWIFCLHINDIHDLIYAWTGRKLFAAEIYHMDRIPVSLVPTDILLATVPPVVIGFAASLLPASWAPRRDPIRAIQHE